ncbi:MAG: hypothetical protein WC209_04540 [Ignavibacteriaceae bacterium]|jgi:hypothetical protein
MSFYKNALLIDKILRCENLNHEIIKNIESLTQKTELRNYFWRNLTRCEWLPILSETGFFKVLSASSEGDNELFHTQSFISEYLVKAATDFPIQVIRIIKSIRSDNNWVIWNFVELGLTLDGKYTVKLIPEVKRWAKISGLSSTNFSSSMTQWIDHLVKGNQCQAALKLLKILSTPAVLKPSKIRDKAVEKIIGKDHPKAISIIDYYYLNELLTKGLNGLIEKNASEVASILEKSLVKAIKIEFNNIKNGGDLSYVWRSAIEDHEQNYNYYELKESLLVALRNALEKLVVMDEKIGLSIIEFYLKNEYSIFNRLAIHLLRFNRKKYLPYIKELIKNKELLTKSEIFHEYYLLLRDIHEELSEEEKDFIINSILAVENYNSDSTQEMQEKQKRYYWFGKLNLLEKYLKGKNRDFYKDLRNEFKEEKVRDTFFWHESYSGEKSPISVNELSEKEITEAWKYLKDFRVTKDNFDSPTHEGLARTFSEVVKNNPDKFLGNDLTPLLNLNPQYSYWFINQIAELYKSDNYKVFFQYTSNLLSYITEIIKIDNGRIQSVEDGMPSYVGVKKRSLDFIQTLIRTHKNEFGLEFKEQIWEIINYLCYYKDDPNDTPEKNDSSLNSYTLAINSVRGTAVGCLIDYALWFADHTKDKHKNEVHPNRLLGEERVLKLLEDKLINKQNDPSLAIHSIFGVYLPNLAYLNYNWVKKNIPNIFTDKNEYYWRTAWGAYISSSKFYSDLFQLLKPQLNRALNDLSIGIKMIPAAFGRTPEEALSEHFIIACLNSKEDILNEDSLLRKFAKIKNNPSATHAVQFIANLARNEKVFHEYNIPERKSFWPQAKEFWKIRLEVVQNELQNTERTHAEDEFDREFSLYLDWLSCLPAEITVEELESLLDATIKINQKGWHLPNFIDYLVKESEKYPDIAIRLFEQLMNTKAPDYFYHSKMEKIKLILERAIKTEKLEAIKRADFIANKFGEWGNYYFKDFWVAYLQDKQNLNYS